MASFIDECSTSAANSLVSDTILDERGTLASVLEIL
jgi:hypothetical protein